MHDRIRMESKDPITSFGEALRSMRERFGMTQFDVAEKSGISQSTISALETGKQRPWPSTRKNLAAAFGLSLEEFDRQTVPRRRLTEEGTPEAATQSLDRLVAQFQRLQDRLEGAETELGLLRRVIEYVPILVWKTNADLILTSAMGWMDFRAARASEIIGMPVVGGLDLFFPQAGSESLATVHRDALAGLIGVLRVESDLGDWILHVEAIRGGGDSVLGCAGVAVLMARRA